MITNWWRTITNRAFTGGQKRVPVTPVWIPKTEGKRIKKCNICGGKTHFDLTRPIDNLRETEVCRQCHAIMRNMDVAQVLLLKASLALTTSLREAGIILGQMNILELAHGGAIGGVLLDVPGYQSSEYFDDVEPGACSAAGIRCEDVQALTFPENHFDFVISQDVFEHVPDIKQGFSEIWRVLKPGGYHVFTIPYHRNTPHSVVRAAMVGSEIKHILEPAYHGDPVRSEGALVFTDFGQDIRVILTGLGFDVELYEHYYPAPSGGYNVVFCTRKAQRE